VGNVCLHYLVGRELLLLSTGNEQFCVQGSMLGHFSDGGYAEYIAVPEQCHPPAREHPFRAGAILMCSSATAFHALRKSRLKAGESVAVFGVGGWACRQCNWRARALEVYAVDINPPNSAGA
jgi:propanol-preferring alcohol dehydrogenase